MPYKVGTPSDLKRKKAEEVRKLSKADRAKQLGPGVTVNPSPKAGVTEPEYIVDKDKLQAMAATMCSYDDMALVFGVPEKFLRDNYKDVIEAGKAQARNGLRSAQFTNALGGNVIMQIWLGKQYLDQKDASKTELSGPDGKPMEFKKAKTVLYVPDNGRDPVK